MTLRSTHLQVTNAQHSVLQAIGPGASPLPAHDCFGWRQAGGSALGFNGQRVEPLTGRYHLGHGRRVYNPLLRRFHEPDNLSPFGAGGFNAYSYCQGDPLNYRDPSGAQIEWMDNTLTEYVVPALALLYDIFSVMAAVLTVATTTPGTVTRVEKLALIGTMGFGVMSIGETTAGLIAKNDELKFAGTVTAGGSVLISGMGFGARLRRFMKQSGRWKTFVAGFKETFDFSRSRRGSDVIASDRNSIPMVSFGLAQTPSSSFAVRIPSSSTPSRSPSPSRASTASAQVRGTTV